MNVLLSISDIGDAIFEGLFFLLIKAVFFLVPTGIFLSAICFIVSLISFIASKIRKDGGPSRSNKIVLAVSSVICATVIVAIIILINWFSHGISLM